MGSWTGSPTRWSDGSGVGPDADRADAGWGARDEPVSGPHWADPPSRYAEVLPFTRTPRGGSATRGSRSADNGRATAVNGRPVSGPAETVVPTPRPAPAGESIQPGGADTGRAANEPTARMAGGPADDPTPPGGSAERRGGDNPRPTPTPVNPPPRWQETARVVPTAPLRAVPVASAAPVSPARPARPGTPPGFQPPPTGQPGAQRSEPDDRPVEPDRQRSAQSDLPPDRPDLPPDRSGMSPDQSGLPGTPADRSAAGPAGRTADAAGRDEPARRDDFAPTPPQPAGQPSNVGPLRQPTGERPGPGAGGPWSRQVTGEWPRPGTADELRRPVPTSAAPAADQWHRQSATGEWPRPTSSAAWDRPADDVPGDRTQRGQGSPSGPASGPPAGEPDWTDGPTDSSWAATDSGGQVWAAEAAGGPSGPVERDDAEPSGWSDDQTAPADSGWSGPPPPSWGGDDRSGWPGAASGESGWAMPDPPTVPEELPWRPDRPADLGQAAGYRPVSGQPRYEPTAPAGQYERPAPAEQYEPTAPAGGQYGPGRPGQGDSGGDADGLMPRRRAVSRRADDELGEATVSGPTGASVPAEPPGAPATAEPAGGALPPVEHPADLSTTPIAAAALDSLPQRVPADPDVPTVPQQLPPVEHAAETPELARIASHLRRGDVVDQPQERPEGFDVGAILAAVRGVGGVRDASLRTTDAGAHSLRLDLSEGADPAEVSRLVARLLQERMGLAAAPQNLPGGEPDHGLPALPGRADLPAPGRPPGSTAPPLTAPGGVPGWVAPEPADVPRRRRQPLGPRPGQDDPPPRHAGAGATAATSAVPCVEPGGTAPESGPPRPLNPGGRPGPRVVLDHVQVSTFGVDATVEVRLTAGQRTTSGVATGPAVDGYVLRLCAVAAASSIEKLLTGPAGAADRGRCIVEHAAVVPMGGCEVAVVVVLLACGGWVEQLAGSAVVSGDPRQAVVRATLAAVNRRLDALLA